jgi:hypothetical protein
MARMTKRDDTLAPATLHAVHKPGDEPKYQGKAKTKEKNPHAVALGRLGGLKGGKARAAMMTASQRREIARRAAMSRWQRQREQEG